MSSDYDLTEQDIKEGIRLCHQNVNLLLDDAEALLARGDRYISTGLYTFAVEELGKLLLLLKELPKASTGNIVSVDPEIFGQSGGGHTSKKFNEFLNAISIPDACKELRRLIGGVPTTTGFMAIFEKVSIRMSLRKKIFYVDWNNRAWVRRQDIEIADLCRAITELRTWMASNITIP